MLVPQEHPLATVNDSYNAVFVKGDAVGDACSMEEEQGKCLQPAPLWEMFFDIVRNILFNCTGRISCTCYKNLPVKEAEDIESRFFMLASCR